MEASVSTADTRKFFLINYKVENLRGTNYVLDAVGSWQMILPMPNLGRPY